MPADPKEEENVPTAAREVEDWRQLAAHAAHEQDPEKLLALVNRLCDLFDQRRSRLENKDSANS